MRSNHLLAGPGFEIGFDWDATTGVLNGLWCENAGPYVLDCTATLDTAQTFTVTFPIGAGQFIPITGSGITVVDEGGGEYTFVGLHSYGVSPRLP
jgi:hypothetical protein